MNEYIELISGSRNIHLPTLREGFPKARTEVSFKAKIFKGKYRKLNAKNFQRGGGHTKKILCRGVYAWILFSGTTHSAFLCFDTIMYYIVIKDQCLVYGSNVMINCCIDQKIMEAGSSLVQNAFSSSVMDILK